MRTRRSGRRATSRASPTPCARAARRWSRDSGITTGLEVLDLGCGDGTTAVPEAQLGADVLGVDIARNLVEAGNARAQGAGPDQLHVPGRRRVRPERARGRQLRPRRQHLRRDVRPEAVRRGEGDGARDAARRPDRDGELDPQRPDAGGPDPEDQLRLLAAAAGRIRQPDDVGRREQRDRAVHRRRGSRRADLVRTGHVRLRLLRIAGGVRRHASGTTTGRP